MLIISRIPVWAITTKKNKKNAKAKTAGEGENGEEKNQRMKQTNASATIGSIAYLDKANLYLVCRFLTLTLVPDKAELCSVFTVTYTSSWQRIPWLSL